MGSLVNVVVASLSGRGCTKQNYISSVGQALDELGSDRRLEMLGYLEIYCHIYFCRDRESFVKIDALEFDVGVDHE